MNGRFFCTGLPRSRTAWLSVALGTRQSMCFHEPSAYTNSFEDLCQLWKPRGGVSVGVSDSALSYQIGRILEVLKPHTLIIDRPVESCIASYMDYALKCGIQTDYGTVAPKAYAMAKALDEHRSHPLVKTVAFANLADYDTVMHCLRWLVPETDFPDVRFLMGMNIQVDKRYLLGMLAKPHNNWWLPS